ncbi:MAG TPA: hypothetical protein DD435_16985 [Cyanobacteria bacterium UBA8530]|nr:hypothetical protein [Cyanobacteria bacterium UBA8530]
MAPQRIPLHPSLKALGERVRAEDPFLSRIRSIGNKISLALPLSPPCRFELLQSDRVNAYALPGNLVALTLGAVRLAGDDAGIAGLLGHEIAHLLLRHRRRGSAQEFEADRVGRQLAVEAGFDRDGLKNFLEGFDRLLSASPDALRSFSHPPTRQRLEKLGLFEQG